MSNQGEDHADAIDIGMAELMQLKETNPQEFETYVQMAEDAAKLASEQPEIFKALTQNKGVDSHLSAEREKSSPALVHQRKAMHAASQQSRTGGDRENPDETLHLPGGRTFGLSGSEQTHQPGIVSFCDNVKCLRVVQRTNLGFGSSAPDETATILIHLVNTILIQRNRHRLSTHHLNWAFRKLVSPLEAGNCWVPAKSCCVRVAKPSITVTTLTTVTTINVFPPTSKSSFSSRVRITPEPGFVIKTRLVEEGIKVFVNVCHHDRIGDSGMVKKLDKDGTEHGSLVGGTHGPDMSITWVRKKWNALEGLNIPMSVGPPWVDKDRAGEECIVYDVIIHPKAIEECQSDKTGARRDWLCHLAMQSVMTKHACKLDPKYKLPKLKFKGNKGTGPAPQRIRDDSAKPRISEVSQNGASASSPTKPSTAFSVKTTNNPNISTKRTISAPAMTALGAPITTVLWKNRGCEDTLRETDASTQLLEESVRSSAEEWPDSLQVSLGGFGQGVLIPDALAEVRVQVSAYEVIVKASGHHPLQRRLPYAVLTNSASAEANCHENTLVISILIDKMPLWREPDPGSKPWLLAHALGDGGASGQQELAVKIHETGKCAQRKREVNVDSLPEDRFHIKLRQDIEPFSGYGSTEGYVGTHSNRPRQEDAPFSEGDQLPEDQFHKADIISQHVKDTREQQRREKIRRAEEEREARKKNPQEGVEYVDFDDYRLNDNLDRPGAPNPIESVKEQDVRLNESISSQDISAAARVLGDAVKKHDIRGTGIGSRLSASTWADLLD